jgi:hypothetical protein
LYGVLGQNENHDGSTSQAREGNTHIRVRLRSQRKDKPGHSMTRPQRRLHRFPAATSAFPNATGQQLQGTHVKMVAASVSRPRATTTLSTIRTTNDRTDDASPAVRDAVSPAVRDATLAAVPHLRAFAISLSCKFELRMTSYAPCHSQHQFVPARATGPPGCLPFLPLGSRLRSRLQKSLQGNFGRESR